MDEEVKRIAVLTLNKSKKLDVIKYDNEFWLMAMEICNTLGIAKCHYQEIRQLKPFKNQNWKTYEYIKYRPHGSDGHRRQSTSPKFSINVKNLFQWIESVIQFDIRNSSKTSLWNYFPQLVQALKDHQTIGPVIKDYLPSINNNDSIIGAFYNLSSKDKSIIDPSDIINDKDIIKKMKTFIKGVNVPSKKPNNNNNQIQKEPSTFLNNKVDIEYYKNAIITLRSLYEDALSETEKECISGQIKECIKKIGTISPPFSPLF